MFLPSILLSTTYRSRENLWLCPVTLQVEEAKHTSCSVEYKIPGDA